MWLFSSGPLGTELVDEEGRDIVEATRPKEFDELSALIHPRGERVNFGAWDPDAPPVGFGERLLRLMPATKEATPAGDFRAGPRSTPGQRRSPPTFDQLRKPTVEVDPGAERCPTA